MTRRHTETRTIQCWPGGQSLEYRGDPDGPANQRSLHAGHYSARLSCPEHCRRLYRDLVDGFHKELADDPRLGRYILPAPEPAEWTTGPICPTCQGEGYIPNSKKNPWRKGTAAEWRRIRIELRAEMYGNRDILHCDSALVDELIKSSADGHQELGGFTIDDMRNLTPDPDHWTAEQCREYIDDHGIDADITDPPRVPCTAHQDTDNADGMLSRCPDCKIDDDDPDYLEELKTAVRDNADPSEVYEWWRVSSWLCDQLHAIGEVTIDNDYGYWWGRTCTGQGWIMDGTLQRVAAQFETTDEAES